MNLCIATRKSPLALWQAQWVGAQLENKGAMVHYHGLTTQGDIWLENRLAAQGGKGLFVRELESALLDNTAQLAVHSLKDLPFELAKGLALFAIPEREDPRDAFVCPDYPNLESLPSGARVGTASLRRQVQLRAKRPDLEVVVLRGNVGTRLAKLEDGQVQAAILAVAGLKRLGLEEKIKTFLSTTDHVPAIGQGALAIEGKSEDTKILELVQQLHHHPTAQAITAERAFGNTLGVQCGHAVGAFGMVQNNHLTLDVWVGQPSTLKTLQLRVEGDATQAVTLGQQAAQRLIAQGALALLGTTPDVS